MQAPDFVLQQFSKGDLEIISETLNRAVEAVLTFITEGLEAAMTKYNGNNANPS
jgi:peptidyl-tRNA hydrolase